MNLRSLTLMVACFAMVGLATAPGQAAWDTTSIDHQYPFGHISMAVLDWGQPAVAYQSSNSSDDNGGLKYAWFDLSTWHITSVEEASTVGGVGDMMLSLAILPSGQPGISYMGAPTDFLWNVRPLKYAWFDDAANSWRTVEVVSTLQDNSVANTSLTVLPSGRVAIAWVDHGVEEIADYTWLYTAYLKYAEGDAQGASAWTISTVDTIGTYTDSDGTSSVSTAARAYNCSMTVLPSGQPAIAYRTIDETLHYAAYNGASWNKSVVDSKPGVGIGCSLAVMYEDTPYISYLDTTDGKLCYAWYNSATATWTPTRFVSLSVDNEYTSVGSSTSLARQPSGDPAIAFTKSDMDTVYLRLDGNEWQISSVGWGWSPGIVSLVFLPNGQPAIGFCGGLFLQYAVETAAGGSDDSDDGSDSTDECPDDPNKIAPGSCGCGTPDTDSDGDGLADCIDDGSDPTDECPDSDGDGLGDCLDDCPYDPDKIVEGFCGCGYADTDSDGDGLADCAVVTPPSTHPGGAAVGSACGAGLVETLTLTALAMFVVQPIRRRR